MPYDDTKQRTKDGKDNVSVFPLRHTTSRLTAFHWSNPLSVPLDPHCPKPSTEEPLWDVRDRTVVPERRDPAANLRSTAWL